MSTTESWESLAKVIDNRVLVRSRDRSNGVATAAQFQLARTFNSVSEIELLHFSMSNTIYNIRGFILPVVIAGTPYAVTLPDGNYAAPGFFTDLANALTAQTGTAFTVTVDPVTLRVTIAAGVVFDLLLATGNLGSPVPGHVRMPIGFPASDLTGANSYLGTTVYSLSQPDHIILRIPGLTASRLYGTQNVVGVYVVPISVNFGSQITYDAQSQFVQSIGLINPQGIGSLTVELVDDYNRPLTHIADDWSLILRIQEDGRRRNL